jgi:hypothetical protein
MERQDDNITELNPQAGAELINGVPTQLGRMSLEQLVTIRAGVQNRLDEAHTDLWVVEDVMTRRFPNDPEAA